MASDCSIALMWKEILMLSSISKNSASIRSESSLARIWKWLAAPINFPNLKYLDGVKLNSSGAIYVFVLSFFFKSLYENSKVLLGFKTSWSIFSLSSPLRLSALTPILLRLDNISISSLSNFEVACSKLSASTVKITYFDFFSPLFPFTIWLFSISRNSRRISSNPSFLSDIWIAVFISSFLPSWLIYENSMLILGSKELIKFANWLKIKSLSSSNASW